MLLPRFTLSIFFLPPHYFILDLVSLTACDGAQGPHLRVQMWKRLCVCLTAWLHVKVSPPYKPPREGYISFICEEDYSVLEPIIHSRF